MKRRLMTTVAAVSALLTVLVVAGWGRSLFAADSVSLSAALPGPPGNGVSVNYSSSDGGSSMRVSRYRVSAPMPGLMFAQLEGWHWRWIALPAPRGSFVGSLRSKALGAGAGFFWAYSETALAHGRLTQLTAAAPHWFFLLLLTPFDLVCLRYVLRRRTLAGRRRRGQCLACGYDLRGSDGACPECGAVRATAAAAA